MSMSKDHFSFYTWKEPQGYVLLVVEWEWIIEMFIPVFGIFEFIEEEYCGEIIYDILLLRISDYYLGWRIVYVKRNEECFNFKTIIDT